MGADRADPSSARVFAGTDLSGADFRDVDLSSARITGLISGLTINEVEVAPLISRELDRRFPERVRMRSEDPTELDEVWGELVGRWESTLLRIGQLPASAQLQRVAAEWSAVESLRHLVFVTDDWFRRTVVAVSEPYWPAGLPPTFIQPPEEVGIDADASPGFDEVCAALMGRVREISDYLSNLRSSQLRRPCPSNLSAGPAATVTVGECLHNVLDEFWAHHRYVARDLDTIAADGTHCGARSR